MALRLAALALLLGLTACGGGSSGSSSSSGCTPPTLLGEGAVTETTPTSSTLIPDFVISKPTTQCN